MDEQSPLDVTALPPFEAAATEQLALVLTQPRVLELQALPPVAPPLADGDILVRMDYSAVQPLDTRMLNVEQGPGPGPSTVLGSDGVGTVVQSRCERFPAGSRVVFLYRRFGEECGSWRQEVLLNSDVACIASLPGTLAPQVAAAGVTSSAVALVCLRHFGRGDLVVISGAAGAVGLTLLQMALLRGIRVVALLRGTERGTWIMREFSHLGTLAVVDCTDPNWCELAALCCDGTPEDGGGAHGLIDGVGGEQLAEATRRLVRPQGSLIRYGTTAGHPDAEAVAAAVRSRSLRAVQEGVRGLVDVRDAERQLDGVLELMAQERLRPHAWQMVDWRDAMHLLVPQPPWSKYVSQLTEGQRVGRIILKFG